MSKASETMIAPGGEAVFAPVALPDRYRTARRFRGCLAAHHALEGPGGLACEISLWQRAPRGWVVGLSWTDGTDAQARTTQADTMEAAMAFVESEGPVRPDPSGATALARMRKAPDPADALVQPFLKRLVAVQLRRLYEDLVCTTLAEWQRVEARAEGPRP